MNQVFFAKIDKIYMSGIGGNGGILPGLGRSAMYFGF
jgi:hypothetical protein